MCANVLRLGHTFCESDCLLKPRAKVRDVLFVVLVLRRPLPGKPACTGLHVVTRTLNLIDEVFHIRRESIIHEDREIRLNLLERLNALRNYKVIHRFLSWAGARLSSFTSQPG